MYWFYLVIFILTILNIYVIYALFNKRIMGKIFIIIQIIIFLSIQFVLIGNLYWDGYSDLALFDKLCLWLLFILYFVVLIYFTSIIIRKIIIKRFVKQNVVKTNIKDDLSLATFRYLYYNSFLNS